MNLRLLILFILTYGLGCLLVQQQVWGQCIRKNDSLELVKLYNAAGGFSSSLRWDFQKPMTTWAKVTLNTAGCVKFLDLDKQFLSGSIPSISLPQVEFLNLSNNDFPGPMPDLSLPQLKYLYLSNSGFSGALPAFSGCPQLIHLHAQNNQFNGNVPALSQTTLVQLQLSDNPFSGALPNLNLPKLKKLTLSNNELTTLPTLSKLVAMGVGTDPEDSLKFNGNQFTFEDIILNLTLIAKMTGRSSYAPQDSIFRDTIIRTVQGVPLEINLGIDATIADNQYVWTKNGQTYKTITGSNKLAFTSIAAADAGIYYVRVSNPRAPLLTLYGRRIKIEVSNSCRASDSLELVKFYNATDGPNWKNKWDLGKPMSGWWGVKLSAAGCVTDLEIRDNQLSGTIPNFYLPNLQNLILYDNQLSGNIPNFNLPNLQNLTLNLNQLSGTIPNFNLPNLTDLSLGGNQLSGNIPNFNLPNLTYLTLRSNQMSGTIPNFILPNLKYLYLNENQLSGDIPIFNLPKLIYLILNSNQLSGTIPNFNLPNLTALDLYSNQLSGIIPNFNLPELTRLKLSNNKLSSSEKLSLLTTLGTNVSSFDSLTLYKNKLSFDDIIPNLSLIQKMGLNGRYAPQDSIYRDTLIRITEGQSLSIDLGIDAAISDNQYTWTKNSQTYKTITGSNKLTFASIAATDAGTYHVRVTNPRAPQLTLYGRRIRIEVMSSCRKNDSLELVKLYNATNGPNWTNKWDLSKPINTWYKVTLNTEGCVSGSLDLSNNNLKGSIPNLSLANLNYLFLHTNQLSGSIPDFNLPKLITLALYKNQLSGNIPNFNMPNLTSLLLAFNQLSGTIPNFNLPKLVILSIGENQLSGEIPNFNMPDLEILYVEKAQLTGSIPNFNLPKLREFTALFNQLSGSIPNFNLPSLVRLDLSNNQLSGPIPNFNLPNLTYLILNYNQLSGTIPNFNLPKLSSLSFTSNKLSGSIPDFNLPNLAALGLNVNQLSGSIPNFNLPNLVQLNLGGNQLSGTIPNFNLPKLELLNLDGNRLTGSKAGFTLSKLKTFIFYRNKLSFDGVLPYANFFSVITISYAPQDSIYRDTLIRITEGQSLSLDLGIDATISDNQYTWTKNSQAYKTITGSNKLAFAPIALTDAGTYYVRVTNPRVPFLTLYGRRIRIEVMPSCRKNDSLELVKLYNATDGPNWTNKWDLGKPMSGWYGVKLSNAGCVTEIYLSSNQLSGTIPDFNLPNLTNLYLYSNQLSGTIPNFNMPNLTGLSLSSNKLSGTIPNFILPNLTELDLSYNQLSSTIPNFNLPSLTWLYLYENQLSGPIPNFNLPNLTELSLAFNKLSGTIPNFNLPNLTGLGLYSNQLSGTIPNFNLPNLTELSLAFNKLSGTIPNFNLPNLTWLNLSSNQLSGTIPNFNLPNLTKFFLYNNQLSGIIPNFNLPSLTWLYLYKNQLSGPIPNFNLPNLTYLYLDSNQLSGPIPNFNLPNLTILELNSNQLSGTIPNFNLPKLRRLKLSNNKLSSTEKFSLLTTLGTNVSNFDSLTLYKNKLSFDDIILNLSLIQKMGSKGLYAPQDSIYRDTLIRITEGQSLSIDLGIDATITDNQYTWTKNSQTYKTITGSNKLTFAPIALTDAGTYYVRVTNPRVPFLTLYGRRIRIEVIPSCRKNDSLELVKLYNATNGANWTNNWDLGKPMSGWYGVKLSNVGCVTELSLSSNQLTGTIPNLNLPNLSYLHLYSNQLSGTIPNFNLPKLTNLWLYSNQLSGTIPNFNLPNLAELSLSLNKLSGNIPNFNLPNLTYLNLALNKLSGTIPNFNLPNLTDLDLAVNQLSGSIPNFNLPNLIWLDLSSNQLSGTIPNFNLPNLTKFFLYNNQLSGIIPNFNLPILSDLRLYRNQLIGTIPNFNLPNLSICYLDSNQLIGTIPNFNLPNLRVLWLNSNLLSGTIPNFNLPDLEELDLHFNQLSGTIPNFNLPNLTYLNLFNNQLNGTIPNFNLPNLIRLYLRNNKLNSSEKLSLLTSIGTGISEFDSLTLVGNKLSFDDIIPNIALINKMGSKGIYAPQDSIYRDTLIRLQTNQTLNLDLGIDASLTTNRYQWYKNGQPYGNASNSNKFTINNLKTSDAGTYRVQVTNPAAPALTLYSRAIRLEVTCANNPNAKISSSASKDTVCAGSSLTLTASGGSTYKWSTGQTTPSIALNITQTQNYQVTITDANNCTISLSKNIVQAPLPQAEISALDYRICTGGSMELRTPPQTNGKYEWLRNGQSLGAANSNNSYKATQTGLYTVRVSNQSGCATLSKEFNLQEGTLPKAEISAASNIVCTDSKLSLNAVPVDGAQYQWFRNGSSVQGPSNSGAFEATQEGNYTLRVSLVSGCAGNSAPFAVQRGGSSVGIRLSPLRDTICRGDSLYLSVSGGLRYTWSTNSTSSGIAVKPSQNTLYTVTVEDAGNCKVTLSQNIVVARDLQAQLTLKEEDCGYVLLGSATGGRGPYTYRWSNGQTQAQLRNPAPGAYNLQIQDSRKCVGRANISVDSFGILAGPPQHFDANCGETNGQIVLKLRQDRGPFSFEWMPFDQGTGDSIRTGLGPGEYTAIITDNQDCKDTVAVTIEKTEDCDKDFLIFRSFSPNGDGVNETFVIQAKQSGGCPSGELNDCYPNNELIVFNRWGDIVYRKRGYESDWKAEDLPGGAYFFMFYPDRGKPKVVVKRALTVVK